MGGMKIAVHQPNYLPWLGYFHKISRVDAFVFLDTVQFSRRGYTHRVHVMGPGNAALWLTQSIRKRAVEEQVINEITFSDKHWVGKHLKTFETVYRRTPHFSPVFALLENGLTAPTDRLARFNGTLIEAIARAIGISTPILYASDLPIDDVSSPSERIARIARHLDATLYLSGSGARAYNDSDVFARHGVELLYNDFSIKPYSQHTGRDRVEFIGGLSVIDALFNLGFEGISRHIGIMRH